MENHRDGHKNADIFIEQSFSYFECSLILDKTLVKYFVGGRGENQ